MDAERVKELYRGLQSMRVLRYPLSGIEAEQHRFFAAIDAMQAEIDRMRNDAISALAAGGVLIRLPRVEGYEEVCDELLAADALEGINWPSYEVLTAEEAKGTT